MLERKTLLGLTSNHLAIHKSPVETLEMLTSMYRAVLRFQEDQSRED